MSAFWYDAQGRPCTTPPTHMIISTPLRACYVFEDQAKPIPPQTSSSWQLPKATVERREAALDALYDEMDMVENVRIE